jgi:hypothetical protein
MFDIGRAAEILVRNGFSEQEAIEVAIEIANKQICLGGHVYCVTQYSKTSPWEVIDAVVTRTHVTNVLKKIFSVEGQYARSSKFYSPYHANFTENSIGKNVFFTEAEAQAVCDKKNEQK